MLINMNNKSQAWGMDLTVASVLFIFGIVVFYFYALNNPNEAQETIDALFYDGNIIADSILSEGHPSNWNSGNVVTIGILSQGKINETKLKGFYDLASSDYQKTKHLFNTKYEYYFNLSEVMIIDSTDVEGIGLKPSNPENIIKITRFSIYKNKPISAYLYMWN